MLSGICDNHWLMPALHATQAKDNRCQELVLRLRTGIVVRELSMGQVCSCVVPRAWPNLMLPCC